MYRKPLLAFALFLLVTRVEVAQRYVAEDCTSLPPLTVAVDGYRNKSGYWISEERTHVVVEGRNNKQGGVGGWHESGCCHLDIQLQPFTCESGETRADVVLTFSVPPTSEKEARHVVWVQPAPEKEAHHVLWVQPAPEKEARKVVLVQPAPTTTSKPRSTPPVGYLSLQGVGHYRYHSDALSWSASRRSCKNEGGDLAQIDTLEKFSFVKGLGAGWTWIDLHERGTNGIYYTASDNEWTQYPFLQWYPGQPNFRGGSDCILLLMRDGRIGDTPCEPYRRHYLCEIPW